jgi:hypothetical protein
MHADFRGLLSPGAAKTVEREHSLTPVISTTPFQFVLFSSLACKDDAKQSKVSTHFGLACIFRRQLCWRVSIHSSHLLILYIFYATRPTQSVRK